MPAASVTLCVKNVEKYIDNCLSAILNQTFTDFEVIIVDEYDSNDQTRRIIENFKDKRVRYFKNQQWLGISRSRNLSVKYARGDYIFFTDGDCIVSKDWIEQGIKFIQSSACAGVEGKSYYVSAEYKPTFSDHTYRSKRGGFMTNNIAYKKSAIESVNGFDERYSYHEDRDLALRIQKRNTIAFNPKMIVFVQKENVTYKRLLRHSPIIKNRVYLFKRFRDKELISWRIVDLRSLIKLLCPPTVFLSLVFNNFKSTDDYRLIPFTYLNALSERFNLWKECVKERVFLI